MGRFAEFHPRVRAEHCWGLCEKYGDFIAALLRELNTDVFDGKWAVVTSADRGTYNKPTFPSLNLVDLNSDALISVQFDWPCTFLVITAHDCDNEKSWSVGLPKTSSRLLHPEILSKLFEAEMIAKLAAAAVELS